jgi:excisionase family DNA binding protein
VTISQITKLEPLWDVHDVARFLKVSRSWVYERTMTGEIPSLRLGGLRRYDPTKVRAYSRGEVVTSAPPGSRTK